MTEDIMLLTDFLSVEEQKQIYQIVTQVQPPGYCPETKWGKKMNLTMNCLGWHWNPKTYKYEKNRTDFDGLEVSAIPAELNKLAEKIINHVGWEDGYLPYDICICNWYEESVGKLGTHQDNSESKQSLGYGYPVLSISIGASCEFVIGGTDRKDPLTKHTLKSGDIVLFGKSKRLAFHGVNKIFPGTTPVELDMPPGRLNLTFRIK